MASELQCAQQREAETGEEFKINPNLVIKLRRRIIAGNKDVSKLHNQLQSTLPTTKLDVPGTRGLRQVLGAALPVGAAARDAGGGVPRLDAHLQQGHD